MVYRTFMKPNTYLTLTCAVGLLFAAGCGKTEEVAVPATPSVTATTEPAGTEVKKAVDATAAAADTAAAEAKAQADAAAEKAAADLKAAQNSANEAAAKAQADAATITSKAQSSIDAASKLVADGKWSEALKVLTELASLKLTPEQQATVDKLTQQAQKLAQDAVTSQAADKGAKAVGDLFKKK